MKIAAGWYAQGLGLALGVLVGALVLGTALPHGLRALAGDGGSPSYYTDMRAKYGLDRPLVEQFAAAALAVADYGYVLENGRISVHGPAEQLRDDPAVRAAYLGGSH